MGVARADRKRELARRAAADAAALGGRVVDVVAPVNGSCCGACARARRWCRLARLVELGDPGQLEVVADLLSTDAVQVRPGARS